MIRSLALAGMEPLGFKLDPTRNAERHKEPWKISADDSAVAMYVIPAGEEMMIALDVHDIITGTATPDGLAAVSDDAAGDPSGDA